MSAEAPLAASYRLTLKLGREVQATLAKCTSLSKEGKIWSFRVRLVVPQETDWQCKGGIPAFKIED